MKILCGKNKRRSMIHYAEDNLSVTRADSEAYKNTVRRLAVLRKLILEEKQDHFAKQKFDERIQDLEQKKAKLDSDRKKLEEKFSMKINRYEEKCKRNVQWKFHKTLHQTYYGKTRFVAERFFAWLKCGFHRTIIRYERNCDHHIGFVYLASILMYWRVLG